MYLKTKKGSNVIIVTLFFCALDYAIFLNMYQATT